MKPRLRYSLRALFVAITLLTVFGGRELHRQSQQARAVAALRDAPNTYVGFDYDLAPIPEWAGKVGGIRSSFAAFVRKLTGSDFFHPVVRLWLDFDVQNPDAFAPVALLPHLKWLQAAPGGSRPIAGDAAPSLTPLTNCPQLEYLALGSWLILTPSGSPGWRGTGTTLSPLLVTASDVAEIRKLKRLRVLAIGGSGLTDEAIDDLARLRQLKFLYLSHTGLTLEGFQRLQSKMPRTTVIDMNDNSLDYSAEIRGRF